MLAEYETVIDLLLTQIKLSPYNSEKSLHCGPAPVRITKKLFFSDFVATILIFAAKCRVNHLLDLKITWINRKLNSDQFSPLNFSNRTNGSKVMPILQL